ncbi:glutaminyl-peptide cyclotransferase [Caldilinea sp.]|uniref:glutaminyl-peptide cyclotransferase n=1 Tax=Caldilinea sp. TaxID=2293560 RepID=UPI002BEFF1F6|nr:glutaminyl-peptide cyclotransferase [Caldilinea sp.]
MNARSGLMVFLIAAAVLVTGVFVFSRQARTNLPAATDTMRISPTAATASIPASPSATQGVNAQSTAAVAATAPDLQASPLAAPAANGMQPALYDYTVVNTFPHDPTAFTQGLVYLDGILYEGTGLYGRSSLRKVELATGQVLQQHDLNEIYFGEGIALLGDQIYQLTWKNGVGFIYDRETFEEKGQFSYATEGWGLTHDGQQLIMSDGTPVIYFLDPATLQETRRITVTAEGQPLAQLNELEYIDGKILANVWQTDLMVRIDPATGIVDGVYDFTGLLAQGQSAANSTPPAAPPDVLNGIAYDPASGHLFVTGKLWPTLFEVEMHAR